MPARQKSHDFSFFSRSRRQAAFAGNPGTNPRRAEWIRVQDYLLAIILSGLTLIVRLVVMKDLNAASIIVFTIPIVLSAYRGGVGPGLLATMLVATGADYFLLPPIYDLRIVAETSIWQEGLLLGIGTLISLICELLHRTQRKLQVNLDELGVVRDEIKSTLDALGESDELYAKSFRLSPECMAIARMSDSSILQANDAVGEQWGAPPVEIVGKMATDYIKWENDDARQEFARTLQQIGECLHFRTRMVVAGGEPRDFELSSRIITFRGETCVLSVTRDLTDCLRSESAASELAAIVESTDDAIVGKDLHGMVRSWNAGAEKLFGYSAAAMVGQPILKIIPPDRIREEDEIRDDVRKGTISRPVDTLRLRKDGSLIDVSITASPIKDRAGKTTGVSMVARGITERKQAERALKASESSYRALFEYAPDGILIADRGSNYLDANGSVCNLLGYLREELVGKHARDIVVAGEGEEIDLALAVIKSGSGYPEEWQFRRKDGSTFPAEVLSRRMPDGNLLSVIRDVSDRREMELAMGESDERFKTMANSIPQLAWIARPDGYVSWYNDRWYEYTGVEREDLDGWDWQSVHDPEILPGVIARWTEAIATGESFDMEFPLRGRDGEFRAFLTKVQPLKDADGRVIQWLGTNTDIEGLKQTEERVRQLNEDLERRVAERTTQLEVANKELEAFSYSVSHDLRSPLRAIDGFSQAVLDDYGDEVPEECRRYLSTIRDGAQRMGALIDDLLTFSRLSRLPLSKQRVNVRKLVGSVLEEIEIQEPHRKVEVNLASLPDCDGDAALLRQVWVNLISNAFKYSRKRESAQIEIGYEKTPEGNAYYVRDNGTGFDMRYAGKLFGVFQRLHRAEDFEGTGVGLAIVQRVIHRHGGKVWAHAAPNLGSTFFFTLESKKINEPRTSIRGNPTR